MSVRLETEFDFPLGAVVHDTLDNPWVFIGWTLRTTGKTANFVMCVKERWAGPAWEYHVDFTETLLRKFPDAEKYRTLP
jgi:hypothetical protein